MANFVVTTLNDELDAADTVAATANPNDLSLREALALTQENGAGTSDVITFHANLAPGMLTLTQGELVVAGNVTIDGDTNGDNRADITIDGNQDSRVFHVTGGTSRLDALTITGGYADGAADADRRGAGLYIAAGATVTIVNTTVSDNRATLAGGGIFNLGTAILATTTLWDNAATDTNGLERGGGIFNDGTLTTANVTFANNFAGYGGGLFNSGTATLFNTTIALNSSGFGGGGIASTDTTNVINSIVAGNGGGHGENDLRGNGFVLSGVNVLGNPYSHPDFARPGIDIHASAADLFVTTPPANPELTDNGGPVQTLALNLGSVAQDAGVNSALPADTADVDGDGNTAETLPLDAHGLIRVVGGTVDIGAFEQDFASPPHVLWLHDDRRLVAGDQLIRSLPESWQLFDLTLGDFDGDGDSDILFRLEDNLVFTWEIEDNAYLRNHEHGRVGVPDYTLEGTGDFDADGDDDVLWRHDDGSVVAWEMEDGRLFDTHQVASAAHSYEVDAIGDVDGDGDADIIWRHQEGAVVTWEMEDNALVQSHSIASASTNWQIEGAGDFDRDGDADILWRHRDGAVVTWEMEDGAYVQNHNIASAPDTWQIEGAGDFDRDGDADILWRHVDGNVVTWEMEASALVQNHNFGIVSLAWQIRGTGAFDLG